MRAVVIEEDRTLTLHGLDEPEPGPGEVRVRVEACGICGSDLHGIEMPDMLGPGSVMGHEFSGVVDALGQEVEGWSPGDRVCVYPFKPLDHHDVEAAMGSGLGLGQRPGAYAEAVCADAEMLWRLPEGMELEHGALVEPLAVALHGLNIAGVRREDACVVLGAGPIGCMVALALEARGIERLVVIEPNAGRRKRLEDLGFHTLSLDGVHETVLERLGGLPRVVLECAGHPDAPGLAVELVAGEGIVALLGVLPEPVAISQLGLMLKEAQIRSSFAYRPSDFDEAVALIAGGRVAASQLVTAREPLERAPAMFDELRRAGTDQLKVLLKPALSG